MKAWRVSVAVVVIAVGSGYSPLRAEDSKSVPVPPSPVSAPQGFADIVAPLLTSVVNISTKTKVKSRGEYRTLLSDPMLPNGPLEDMLREFFDQGPTQKNVASLGSGFIVAPEGYIVTNYHVVEEADEVTVILNDNTKLKATIVGRDHRTDIAVLKVETKASLPFVSWGDSEKLRTGDWILAIGNPFGLGGTVTAGIVSTIKRDISGKAPDTSANYIPNYIQTDASINVGNSGGPMFNMQGQVVGINRAIFSPTGGNVGISFAIPSSIAQKVVDQIRQFGRTKRGWVGVRVLSVTEDIAEGLGFKTVEGALVGSVIPGSPAALAKIMPGDVILKVGETPVKDSRSVPQLVGEMVVGSEVPLTIWRKGKIFVQKVKVGEFEEAEDTGTIQSPGGKVPSKETKALGMSFQISDMGVEITDLDVDSNAAQKGIQEHDVIVEISQEEVKTPQDVVDLIAKAKKAGRKSVLLLISRDGEMRYVSVRLEDE